LLLLGWLSAVAEEIVAVEHGEGEEDKGSESALYVQYPAGDYFSKSQKGNMVFGNGQQWTTVRRGGRK
jgi:hypothetical protein